MKIVLDEAVVDRLWVDIFLEAHRTPPAEIVLDLDATDDPVHGDQEGLFSNGYYCNYCYMTMYIFCGDMLRRARQRPSNIDASAGCLEEVKRIGALIRITVRKVWMSLAGGFPYRELFAQVYAQLRAPPLRC